MPEKHGKPTAIAYCRVSTAQQVSEGASIDAQTAAVRRYCDLRGFELRAVVVDAGVSAAKPLADRRGGRDILAAIEAGARHVVAYKLDRLFRDASDCLVTVRQWDSAGVALHLVDLGGAAIDTKSPMGRFFLTVMAGAAEMERALVAERTAAVLAHKRSQNERLGGDVPYGYRLAEDRIHLEPDPDEQAVIARIRELRATRLSIEKICWHLNATGVPARGKKWHKPTVWKILRRREQAS